MCRNSTCLKKKKKARMTPNKLILLLEMSKMKVQAHMLKLKTQGAIKKKEKQHKTFVMSNSRALVLTTKPLKSVKP